MSSEEKELYDLVDLLMDYVYGDHEKLAKAIIARYPQIIKKPVKIKPYGIDGMLSTTPDSEPFKPYWINISNKYRFMTKEERQEWIDQHYVEVIDDAKADVEVVE